MNYLRLTGVVVASDVREGQSKSGAAYRFEVLRVMVPERDFVEVTLNDRANLKFGVGEAIDVLVRVSTSAAGRLRIDVAEAVPASVLDLAA